MFRNLVCLLLLLSLTWVAQAQGENLWEEIPRPKLKKGLMVSPKLCAVRSRIHLFWAGTSAKIRRPELFHVSMSDGDSSLPEARAPFFGAALSRVRKIAVGNARHMIGVLFQRQISQSSGAYDLLMTISNDHGWSFSRPYVIDSYVYGESGGSWVSIDGREGTNRPEFCGAWVAEGGQVKVATLDIASSNRPRSQKVGRHDPGERKVEVASLGRQGFTAVWSEGGGLKTARIKPLVGGAEDAFSVLKGNYGDFFTLAGSHRGPASLVAGDSSALKSMLTKGTKWNEVDLDSPQLPSGKLEARSDLDSKKNVHMLVYTGDASPKMYYTHQTKEGWSTPELVFELSAGLPCTGFDIGATKKHVYAIAAQGHLVYLARRPRPKK